jgi:hypothetical protein
MEMGTTSLQSATAAAQPPVSLVSLLLIRCRELWERVQLPRPATAAA